MGARSSGHSETRRYPYGRCRRLKLACQCLIANTLPSTSCWEQNNRNNAMLLRSACILLLTVTTAFSQVGFGPFMKHEFTISQGTARIMLHGLPSGGDWMLAVKIGAATHLQVMKVRVLPFVMQEWQDLRTADGLIDISGLDTLPGYTLSINMEVPLDTNVSVQNDSAVLFTRRIDGGLVVRNGVVQPVLIASGR